MKKIIGEYQQSKYKGMYKNILNSNRRGIYTNCRKYIKQKNKSSLKEQHPGFFTCSPLKIDEKKKASISARRICDDLDDPKNSKNLYFK